MTRRVNRVLQQLRLSLGSREAGTLSDGQLLGRWTADRDEAAFELLVRRHGPMVLGVCRRLLGHVQDAEDAFQATFLALVRKADAIHKQAAISSWLYKVAYRVALRARTRSASRPVCSARLEDVAGAPVQDYLWSDLRPVLDEEVSRLPRCFQDVFILCQLEGKTNEEVARQLGCPLGTVVSRLSRARERLRTQLVRRGLTLSAGVLATTGLIESASGALPPVLVSSTTELALIFVNNGPEAATISTQITTLTNGVLKTMFMTKLRIVAAVALAVCLLSGGLTHSLVYRSMAAAPGGEDEPGQVEKKSPTNAGWRVLATYENKSPVQGLAFTPDGERLVVGDKDGGVRIWDIAAGQGPKGIVVGDFDGDGILDLAISPDGKGLAVRKKATVVLRDVKSGKIRWIHDVQDGTGHFTFAPDGQVLVFSDQGGVIRLLDVGTGKEIRRLPAQNQKPSAVAFSPDGRFLVTAAQEPGVRLWEAATGRIMMSLKLNDPVTHVAVGPDGKYLLLVDVKGTLHLADLPTGKLLRTFVGQPGRATSAAFSPDGKRLVVVGQDPVVRVWDVDSGIAAQLKQHQGRVRYLAFSPDGKTLATGADDRRVVLWRLASAREIPARITIRKNIDRLDRLIHGLIQDKRADRDCVDALYLTTLGRYPSEVERNFLLKHLAKADGRRQEALDDVVWSLINTREFQERLDELNSRDPRKNPGK
jgi:RNA polymerase sigma factor (sigma-70 family)